MGDEPDQTYEADSPVRPETPSYNSEGYSDSMRERTPPYEEDFSNSSEKSDEAPSDQYEENAVPLKRMKMSEDFDYEEYNSDYKDYSSEDSDHQELSPEEEFKLFLDSEKFVASVENFNKACGTENYYVSIYVDRVHPNTFNVVDVYGHGDRKGMDPLTLESLRRASIEKRIQLGIDGIMSRDTTKLLHTKDMNPNDLEDILLTRDEIQQLGSLLKWLAPYKCLKLYCHLFSTVDDIAILVNQIGFTTLTGIWRFRDLCLPVFEKFERIEVSVPPNWYSTEGARDLILNTTIAYIDLNRFRSGRNSENEGFPFDVVQKLIEAWIGGAIGFEERDFLTSFGMEELERLLTQLAPYRVRRLYDEDRRYWRPSNNCLLRRDDGDVMKIHYIQEGETITSVRFNSDSFKRKKVEVVTEEREEKSPDEKRENDAKATVHDLKEDHASAKKSVPSPRSIAENAPKHASTDFFNKVTSGQAFSAKLCVSRRESVAFDLVYYDSNTQMIMNPRTLESLRKASVERRIQLEIQCVASIGELINSSMEMKQQAWELVLTKEEARQLHEFLKGLAPTKCGKLCCNLIGSVDDAESLVNTFGFTELAGLWRFSGDDLFRPVFKNLDSMKLFMPVSWFVSPRAMEFMLTTKIREVEVYTWTYKYEKREAFSFEIMQEFIESWLAGNTFHRRVFEAFFLVEELLDFVRENFNEEYGAKLRPGGVKIDEDDDDDYYYWGKRTEEEEDQKKSGVCSLRRADGNEMKINYEHRRWGTINIEIVCEERPITADDVSDKEDDEVSYQSSPSSPVKESDLPKKIGEATIENFNKATDQEVFDAVIYVSRVGGITFDVGDVWWAEKGMDLLTLDSLRKASNEKRVQLKICYIASRGALKRINSWEMEPEHAREIVLTKDEIRQLHSFLKWLAPSSCRDFYCQLVPSIENIETLVKEFGFTSLNGIWDYPAESLQRFEKLDSVALTVPLKWLSTPGARDFILNTKIPYVNLKYYKRDEDKESRAFSFEIVEKLIESWLAGATFRGRVFEAGFGGMAVKKFFEERFTIIKKSEKLRPGAAICRYFHAYEEYDHVDWAVYKICREDGAVLKVDYSKEKDWTPYEIELSCEKWGKKV